jgi:hypothetical protein
MVRDGNGSGSDRVEQKPALDRTCGCHFKPTLEFVAFRVTRGFLISVHF